MIEVIGNLWDEIGKADLLLVTTNSSVTRSGVLVMGRGAAKEAALRYPTLPYKLGKEIRLLGQDYGVMLSSVVDRMTQIGAFQVKRHWSEKASLDIITASTEALAESAQYRERIAMNYPGIGNGRLPIQVVRKIIGVLPDNVFIYRRR